MIDLAIALRGVVNTLDELDAEHVVVGSAAAATWGVARATRDVDIVTVVPAGNAAAFIEHIDAAGFYVPAGEASSALVNRGSFNVLHPATGGKVDLFVVPTDDPFERSRLDRRIQGEVLGVATWIATPEDVVLAKLRWRLDSRSEVQWRDCVEIAAVQRLDEPYLRVWADRLGVSDDLEELLASTR